MSPLLDSPGSGALWVALSFLKTGENCWILKLLANKVWQTDSWPNERESSSTQIASVLELQRNMRVPMGGPNHTSYLIILQYHTSYLIFLPSYLTNMVVKVFRSNHTSYLIFGPNHTSYLFFHPNHTWYIIHKSYFIPNFFPKSYVILNFFTKSYFILNGHRQPQI